MARRSAWWGAAWLLATVGCADPEPRPVPVAPPLEPPPAAPDALSPAQVLEIARQAEDAADAIRAIDRRPLGFPLDEAHLEALGREGIDPDVLEYLRRRAKVDWESLRGDIPEVEGGR